MLNATFSVIFKHRDYNRAFKMAFFFSALESTSGGALEEEFLRFQHRSQPQTFHLKDLLSELDSTAAGSSASAAWKSPL